MAGQYIRWTDAQRKLVEEELARIYRMQPGRLSVQSIRADVGYASGSALGPDLRRIYLTPKEAREFYENLLDHPHLQPQFKFGDFGHMTVEQAVGVMGELGNRIKKLEAELRGHEDTAQAMMRYRKEWGSSVFEDARAYRGSLTKLKPKAECAAPAPKAALPVLAFVGVLPKFRHQIQLDYRDRMRAIWTERNDPLTYVARKVSGMSTLVLMPGASPNLVCEVRRVAKQVFTCEGMTDLRRAISQALS